MKLHELKIKHEYLLAITTGFKTFELRKNDRDYRVGDLIHFIEIKNRIIAVNEIGKTKEIETYIDTNILYEITYILKDVPQYGLDKDYCILGIKKIRG